MNITFMQAGGFAGLSRGVELDTATLPKNEAEQVAGLLRAADESAQAGAGSGAGPGLGAGPRRADTTSYLIKIESGGAARELRLSDGSMTDEQAALVQWLASRSKPRRL